mgnify:FL=1
MDLELADRCALVTGGSKGLGRAIAHGLAQEGCRRLHLAARSREALEAVAGELSAAYPVACTLHAVNLVDTGAAEELWSACRGEVDLLINNAGAIPGGGLTEVDSATWRQAWDLKVYGYLDLMRAAYADMAAGHRGVIVNVIGTAGKEVPGRYVAGVSLDDGVRVVGVSPGDVVNERGTMFLRRQAEDRLGDPERWREMLAEQPGGRGVMEQDIADAVLFLASRRAQYISGVTIPVDGGLHARQRVL